MFVMSTPLGDGIFGLQGIWISVSDNTRSGVYMVIYWGKWADVLIRYNDAGAGICVHDASKVCH